MARRASCPSCGAAVEFRSLASILAVCDFCRSTLVRDGEALRNLGRMADLIEDHSLLQRGAEGRWRERHFVLVGRIQYRYDAGLWNEWHLLFDDRQSGWLSEAGGEYVLSQPRRVSEPLPRFADLQVGAEQRLDGGLYRVTNILTAQCVAGEGELPFTVGAGYSAPVVDLRDADGAFATLDYSDGDNAKAPLVFIGASVDFSSLAWKGLREASAAAAPNASARAFNCPCCAAPIALQHENIASVGCASCGAVLDTRNPTLQIIAKAQAQMRPVPYLTLGGRGTLDSGAVEVIGYMARFTLDGEVPQTWNEYLLLGADQRLLWLTEYDGHWNLGRVVERSLSPKQGAVSFEAQEFKHFATYQASVDYVIGEFPWQVRLDETVRVEDYVAPPRQLSYEVSEREETWTVLDYLEPQRVAAAFALTQALPAPRGIYANQVNPYAASHALVRGRFWKFAALATLVHLLLLFSSFGGVLLKQALSFDPNADEALVTREFRLERPLERLDIAHQTDIRNNWMTLSLTLVNKTTGEAWHAQREISAYEGVDDGESWSEGTRSDELSFNDLPAGVYGLIEEAELGGADVKKAKAKAAAPAFVHADLRVARAGPRWSSYFLLLLGLALFPIYTYIRSYGFECKRWAESDHPYVRASAADKDD